MEVFLVTSTDHSLSQTEVLVKLKSATDLTSLDLVSTSLSFPCFSSVLDWQLFECRRHHKLSRKLLLQPRDLSVVLRLLLGAANKELTGDSGFIVSDMIELEGRVTRARRENRWPDEGEDIVGVAAGRFRKFLKDKNLVDRWEVKREAEGCLEAGQRKGLVLWGEVDEVEGMTVTVSQGEVKVSDEKVDLTGVKCEELFSVEEIDDPRPVILPELVTMVSFLRLLVCSKDELALAHVVTTSRLLTKDQFNKVRQEAGKEGMSLYQSIVSWVRKVGLGGKSYQPGEESGLYEFQPSLTEFNSLMERLQTKLEEVSGAENAVKAVLTSVRVWLSKQGLSVGDGTVDLLDKVVEEVGRRLAGGSDTPARGLLGRPAVKLMTGLVDLVSCLAVTEKEGQVGSTPARTMVQFMQTPGEEVEVEDEMDRMVREGGLKERLSVGSDASVHTPVRKIPALPRYRAGTSSMFLEGSPALVASAERRVGRESVRTGGCTLMASSEGGEDVSEEESSVESTRRILQELKEKEEEVEESGKKVKQTKRCLSKEVDSLVREKMGLKPNGKRKPEEVQDENKKVKSFKKKKIATPKGQKKMTSFFTR